MWWVLASAAGVPIEGGSFLPLYPADPDDPVATVKPFMLDPLPVTQQEFRRFVVEHPRWQRGEVPFVLADDGYLASWKSSIEVAHPTHPVTEVSWFAARAYCKARGSRLPTSDEWEYVARASPTQRDASEDAAWLGTILGWYSRPRTASAGPVGQRPANIWGVKDLHGLVWEWVEDYNNTLFGTDAREGGDEEELRFCGAGALSATDVRNYATFMRMAYRSSLKGRYTTRALGFRCAEEAP